MEAFNIKLLPKKRVVYLHPALSISESTQRRARPQMKCLTFYCLCYYDIQKACAFQRQQSTPLHRGLEKLDRVLTGTKRNYTR